MSGAADRHGVAALSGEGLVLPREPVDERRALALAWLLRQPGVVPLAGAKTGEQAARNAKALAVTLSPAEVGALDAVSAPWRVAR